MFLPGGESGIRMRGILLLAVRYMSFHRGKTAVLVACLALTIYLPLAANLVVRQFHVRSRARATATPLVIGAKGNPFGLAIHALYFRGEAPQAISMAEVKRVRDGGLAQPIPLLIRFRARGHVIVGTTPDYYPLRGLTLAEGGPLERLGDCVLGANVARRLGLKPGERLLSEPENIFDLSGPSPLNMRVVGVIRKSNTADDEAVFVDLKTAWIIQGIGHGHELAKPRANGETSGQLGGEHKHSASRANLSEYTEVTTENLASFHFHGEPNDFPVTAIIAIPADERAETLLMGEYLAPDTAAQILRPADVLEELIAIIFQVKRLFDFGAILLVVVTLLLVLLVISLSLRLRQREMETMFKLGCSRFTMLWLQGAELAIVLALSVLLAGLTTWATLWLAPRIMYAWLT